MTLHLMQTLQRQSGKTRSLMRDDLHSAFPCLGELYAGIAACRCCARPVNGTTATRPSQLAGGAARGRHLLPRWLAMLSSSSKKRTQGALCRALSKISRTLASLSPVGRGACVSGAGGHQPGHAQRRALAAQGPVSRSAGPPIGAYMSMLEHAAGKQRGTYDMASLRIGLRRGAE